MTRLLAIAAISGISLSAIAAAAVAPFKAEYVASRNGKELGRTTIELRENADATWTLRTSTVGTSGLAKMAGLDVVEESHVRWRDDRAETVTYDFRQQAALSNKRRHADFDWNQGEVRMTDGDSDARYALVPGTVDRHALTLALVNDLARGATAYDYKVAMKNAVEDVHYTACGDQRISVPAGEYATVCLERVREKRTSTSWFAKATGWIPVQIEQVEKKGGTVTLKLASLQQGTRGE